MDFKVELFVILFTYGFMLTKTLMSFQKHINLGDFDKTKAIVGVVNELGFVLFLYLIYLMPQYIDVSFVGFDLQSMVQVALFVPLGLAIKDAYTKVMELRNIDVSELDG